MSFAHNSCAISWCKGYEPFVQIPEGPAGNALLPDVDEPDVIEDPQAECNALRAQLLLMSKRNK